MASENKLTFRKVVERFSYGCGDFGCNIIYTAMWTIVNNLDTKRRKELRVK